MKRGQKYFRNWHCLARSEGTEAAVQAAGLMLAVTLTMGLRSGVFSSLQKTPL